MRLIDLIRKPVKVRLRPTFDLRIRYCRCRRCRKVIP